MTFTLRRPFNLSVKEKYDDKIRTTGLKIEYEESVDEASDDEKFGCAHIEISTLDELMTLAQAVELELIINCVDPPCCHEDPEITIYDYYIE